MESFLDMATKIEDKIIKWRRDLHQIPEIGNELPNTSKYVQDRLTEMSIPFHTLVNGSAIVALIEGEQDGKTVALRADMDALSVIETAPVDFKSTNGCMHACGHDSHTAMLLGAAEILSKNKNLIKGRVKLLFQPGEEYPGGAKPMIDEGALENPKVDAIFSQHIGVLGGSHPSGTFVLKSGTLMACRDGFRIKIIGNGAHSSTPHLGIDPVAIAAQVINGLYMIKARELNSSSPAVMSVCMVNGGRAANIIPDEVVLEGSTRAMSKDVQEQIAKRMEEVTKSICEAFGATYEYEFLWEYPLTVNNPEMTELAKDSLSKLFGVNRVVETTDIQMGSEDMSFYLNEVPGSFLFLNSIVEQDGVVYGHHNPKFCLDESVFKDGTAGMCQLAIDYLNR